MSTEITGYFGIKFATILAGFFGAVISLEYVSELSRWRKCLAILGGAVCASYGAPIIVHFLALPASLEAGIGFFLGLFGMSIAGVVFRTLDRIDLVSLIKSWRK